MRKTALTVTLACVAVLAARAWATETEHIGMSVVPAPGKVVVDGKTGDWDLAGGVFACGDAENLRDQLACWFHGMYDKDNLYLLARWVDQTPLNNPGTSKGDYGFAGDCLQVRIITAPGQPDKERTTHITAWQDRDGIDVVDVAYGKQFDQGGMKDAQEKGAVQEFAKNADGKGYVQEMSIPWALLTKGGYVPQPGDELIITVEPNFGTESRMRITLKDIFRPGVVPDRVFTFMSSQCWGTGKLEPKGGLAPRPVRLSDNREFKVHMEGGVPVVDWTGLIRTEELKGFKTVEFTMPEDGLISLHILNGEGQVVRQLLNCAFMTKGKHQVMWDGLTTPNWREPGQPVPPGAYTWRAIWHKGIGLRLKGWACNGGSAPWDGPSGKTNWGGDHGAPVACASDGQKVYLGWSGAEAGKAMVACDADGNVQWRCSRGGMSGAELMAVDAGTVYSQNWDGVLFRVDTERGSFTDWAGSGSTDLGVQAVLGEPPAKDERANCLFARGGKVYVGFRGRNLVVVLDGVSGKAVRRLSVPDPADIEVGGDGKLYVVSQGTSVLAVDTQSGEAKPFIGGLQNASGIAVDNEGKVYVGVRDPDNQVKVYDPAGRLISTIGRKGGRALVGKWEPDGMRFVQGMCVDGKGRLWVMEADMTPKRVSVWDTKTGALYKEFFGPTTYGALGGAISPLDPNVMVGQGCEWVLDPQTGRSRCTCVITRDGMEVSRFGVGNGNRLYLAVAGNWAFNVGPVKIYERVGEADCRLRTVLYHLDEKGQEVGVTGHGVSPNKGRTMVWADENGDGQRQPEEVSGADGIMRLSGWYMGMAPDLTFYSDDRQFTVTGFTKCGAPKYDMTKPVKMPASGLGSADGRLVLQCGDYGVPMSWFNCYDIASGKKMWSYPDNFVGVHGSHLACPPQVGMIRGSYGPCGTAKLPDPVGSVWVIPTNVGEWHMLTGDGFYLARLFQGDPMKVSFPEPAMPGAMLDNVPPGLGGEDFGGSICFAADGNLYLQAGKTGFWNVKVVGLESVKAMKGGKLSISAEDVRTAEKFRGQYLQEAAGTKKLAVKRMTPTFTGNLDADFKGADVISFKKQDSAAVRSAAAWDDKNLYLAWEVRDDTPWVNGANAPEFLYASGDTVDFQLGADQKAPADRAEAVLGDLRLSVGPFQGKPTAVVFRCKSADKKPKIFYSGVVRDGYTMESVVVLDAARVEVKVDAPGKRYVVEAAAPLDALGLKPIEGLRLRGDFGVTHGGPDGRDTVLRTYWNNQATGIVNDEVFELKMEPRNWGELTLEK